MHPIEEASRRKPGWTDGGAVVLADGQAWHFPTLRLRLAPGPDGSGGYTVRVTGRVGLPRWPEWRRVLTSAGLTPDVYMTARMDAAATMLGSNYELSDDELAELLAWDEGDEASTARWHAIDSIVLGYGPPKPMPAG